MDPERWRRLKGFIAEALDHDIEHRERYLKSAGLSDEDRRRVEAYIAAHDAEPRFFDKGSAAITGERLEIGQRVDDYLIRRKLGEGGMAEVFEAEQEEPIRRRVALKVLRPHRVGGRTLARFEAERQILASLNHRHIAQVFDAGNLDARPYLAMELIEGTPITDYCDQRRLAIEDRLELFIDVCRGMEHAHQRGIIHRDLKPSNILVVESEEGPGRPLAIPKIIDFGISKDLDGRAGATVGELSTGFGGSKTRRAPAITEEGQWLGTPAYMSPEQASAGPGALDTRSDVYSLGVVLFELMTGELPFDVMELRRQGLDVLLAALREKEPGKPSRVAGLAAEKRKKTRDSRPSDPSAAQKRRLPPGALAERLRGDLDLVILKALAKDPDRRYASTRELGLDLRRHLEHRPLLAAAPSATYMLKKFFRRHFWAAIAIATISLSLVIGMIGTGIGLGRARAAERQAQARAKEAQIEAERANREAETATRVTDFMLQVFKAPNPDDPTYQPGVTLRQVLDRGAERARLELDDEPLVQARLMSTIGRSFSSLGLYEKGMALVEGSVELLESTTPDTPELATTLHFLGEMQTALADHEAALVSLQRALEIRRRRLGPEHHEVTWVLHDIGRVLSAQGRREESLAAIREALALKKEIYGERHQEYGRTLNSLGLHLIEEGKIAEGLPILEEVLGILETDLGSEHPQLSPTLTNLAKAHWDLGQFEIAEAFQRRAMELDRRAYGEDHPYVALSLMNLAFLLEHRGDCPQALDFSRRAGAIFASHYAPDHPQVLEAKEKVAAFKRGCSDS